MKEMVVGSIGLVDALDRSHQQLVSPRTPHVCGNLGAVHAQAASFGAPGCQLLADGPVKGAFDQVPDGLTKVVAQPTAEEVPGAQFKVTFAHVPLGKGIMDLERRQASLHRSSQKRAWVLPNQPARRQAHQGGKDHQSTTP